MEQLTNCKDRAAAKIEFFTIQRWELRKKLRQLTRKGDQLASGEVRGQIGQLSQQLKMLRSEVKLCDGIALRSQQIKDNLEHLLQQKAIERKAKTSQRRNRNYNTER